MPSFSVFTDGVRRQHGMENFSRRYTARFVMDAFARRTGFFGDQHQPVAVAIPKTEVRKSDREADLFAEGVNCSRIFRRGIGELKLRIPEQTDH